MQFIIKACVQANRILCLMYIAIQYFNLLMVYCCNELAVIYLMSFHILIGFNNFL